MRQEVNAMLPIPILDDERFQEIAEQARSMIPRLAPDWTDFNHHDPGITFLELFAFLKESQQYHLDQIGPRNRQKYLKLLGVARQHRLPARTNVIVSGEGGILPAGVRLLAGEIPFETLRPVRLSRSKLSGGFTWDGQRRNDFSAGPDAASGKVRLEVFGREPRPGAVWYLRFRGEWVPEESMHLYLWLSQDWPVRRNPGEEGVVPLAQLSWEALGPEGWSPVEVLHDETRGLLYSGEVALQAKEKLCPAEQSGEEERALLGDGFWIRVRLVSGAYDVPPVVVGISDEMLPAVQRETMAACVRLPIAEGKVTEGSLLSAEGEYELYRLGEDGFWYRMENTARESGLEYTSFFLNGREEGETLLLTWRKSFERDRHLAVGDGFPHQSYQLAQKGQIYESFQLLAAEPDRPGAWSLWERVEDFDASSPEDRHYLLDEETGVVQFGDCIHGLAPEGEILIASQAVTLGPDGDVKAGRVQSIHPEDLALCGLGEEDLLIWNPDDAAGGQERESMEEGFQRCRRLLRRTDRAVTYDDYERLVRQTPGLMISNCKAVPVTRLPRQDGSLDENCVTVVVEPYSLHQERTLSPAYRENILRYLEGRRMLGTKVSLLSPEYVGITIYAEILSQPHYVDARARIQAAVDAFFCQGWEFGTPVRYSVLYGIIDTLDCVQGIESLTIDAQGKGITRGTNGDVILPYNGLAVLKSASYLVRPAE